MVTKIHTMINLDDELKAKAKAKGINISDITERALQIKLGEQTISPKEAKCKFCGREEEQATLKSKGMTWLCPDEVWICSVCLDGQIKKVIMTTH